MSTSESLVLTEKTYTHREAKKALVLLLFIFVFSILCLQAFNLVFNEVGKSLNAGGLAPLIAAIPGIVLGIVSFIYGSLGDFVSLKKMSIFGLALTIFGSVFGFFVHTNVWFVIFARAIQTAGAQFAGSVFLVVAARYLRENEKVIFFGIFTAAYQLATALGVLLGGLLSSIDWAWLFLIPALSVFCIPALLKNLPDTKGTGLKVDVLGFLIFALAITSLTLFFALNNWYFILSFLVFTLVFGVYIVKAQDPFITPAFFKNTSWLKATLLVLIFYSANYSFAPLYNAIGGAVYKIGSAQISLVLLPSYIVAMLVGSFSGKLIGKIGRKIAYILAASLIFVGLLLSGLFVKAGLVSLALSACFVFAGFGMIYSPQIDTVLSTVKPAETGRAVGMDDLSINVAASIGIAIVGSAMSTHSLAAFNFIGAEGSAAQFSNLLLLLSLVYVLGIICYLSFKSLHKNLAKN